MERPTDRKPGISLAELERNAENGGTAALLALVDLAGWAALNRESSLWLQEWLDQWPARPPAMAQAGPAACETCQGRGTVPNPPAHRTEPPYRVPCPDCRNLVEGRAVPWPGITGNVEFALRPGATRADMLEVADVVRARVLQSLEAQLKPDARVTARRAPTDADMVRLATGSAQLRMEAEARRVHRMGPEGLVPPEKLREAMAARCTPEAEARRRELQDQEAQKFLAQAEQVTGYASPYLRKPHPAPAPDLASLDAGAPWSPTSYADTMQQLMNPAHVPPDKVGVPRPAPDRSAWGRRLELAAALLVGALLAWGASHLGR